MRITPPMIAFGLFTLLAANAVQADTVEYQFSGRYYSSGSYQNYTGNFTIVDPQLTPIRPASAPDVTNPAYASIWQGVSRFYTGGSNITITFDSGTQLQASAFEIVVNNTTFSGAGAPYSEGLSAQLYPSNFTLTGPTHDVCATPTGECGEDDDPLYHDQTQQDIMSLTGFYFAFWNGGNSYSDQAMPTLTDYFSSITSGLGLYSPNIYGFTTTTLTTFTSFSSQTIASVPLPTSFWLMASALIGLVGSKQRR